MSRKFVPSWKFASVTMARVVPHGLIYRCTMRVDGRRIRVGAFGSRSANQHRDGSCWFFFYDEEESSEEDSLSLKYRLDLASLMSDHTILGRLIRLPRPTLQHMRPIRPLRPIDQKHVRNSWRNNISVRHVITLYLKVMIVGSLQISQEKWEDLV